MNVLQKVYIFFVDFLNIFCSQPLAYVKDDKLKAKYVVIYVTKKTSTLKYSCEVEGWRNKNTFFYVINNKKPVDKMASGL